MKFKDLSYVMILCPLTFSALRFCSRDAISSVDRENKTATNNNEEKIEEKSPTENKNGTIPVNSDENNEALESQIKNASGDFGGTLDEAKYGRGTPRNGENDIVDSKYFLSPDFFNLSSNQQRLIYSKYQTYLQTMADSDGIACALMVLNRDDYDVNKYNEEYLYNLYEKLNKTTILGKGTTAKGLSNLFASFDYEVEYGNFDFGPGNTNPPKKTPIIYDYLIDSFYNNYTVLMKIHKDDKTRWKLVVGVDGKSPHNVYDDVIIYADPNDRFDHKSDGFSFEPLMNSCTWWTTLDSRGNILENYSFVRIKNKKQNDVTRKYEKVQITQEVPELHLMRNEDGTYGGTTDVLLYGNGTPKNGYYDNYDSIYYKFLDVYNMLPTTSLHVLPNYRGFQQTMASTCGICSTMSVLSYYDGLSTEQCPKSEYNEITLLNNYETINNTNIRGKGITFPGLKKMLTTYYGYTSSSFMQTSYSVAGTQDKPFPTISSLKDRIISNIDLGMPTIVCMKPSSGHYEVIFGYDDMGTETCDDDVILLADSGDKKDHLQDAYNIYNVNTFYSRWFNGGLSIGQMSFTFKK